MVKVIYPTTIIASKYPHKKIILYPILNRNNRIRPLSRKSLINQDSTQAQTKDPYFNKIHSSNILSLNSSMNDQLISWHKQKEHRRRKCVLFLQPKKCCCLIYITLAIISLFAAIAVSVMAISSNNSSTATTTSTTTSTTSTTTTTTSTTSTTKTTTSTTSKTTTTTTPPVCTPFWSMPSSDQGTNLTYFSVNTQISGDQSRSGCVLVRASVVNVDDIVFDVGPAYSTLSTPSGCNTHFALSIINSGHVTVYGMCPTYDSVNIATGQTSLYDGSFHQLCATYNSANAQLCIYQDLHSPQCLIRTNPVYNTGLGDVRLGWWPDGNRPFLSSGSGLIKSLSLFNAAINQSCVAYLYQNNFMSG